MSFEVDDQIPIGTTDDKLVPGGVIHNRDASRYVTLQVPDTFPQLLETIYREVLREQPENIVEFIAMLLADMLMERDGSESRSTSSYVTYDTCNGACRCGRLRR